MVNEDLMTHAIVVSLEIIPVMRLIYIVKLMVWL